MGEQARQFGQAELARAAQILSEGLIEMRGTTSPRLLLELTCAQVLLPAAGTGETAMLARLERLERRLEGASPAAEHGDLPRTSGESLRPAPSRQPAEPHRPAEPQPTESQPAPRAGAEQGHAGPVHAAPAREAPVGQAPVHEAPVPEAPVDEVPVHEAPVREAPVREAPVREAPGPDTSGEAAPEARAGQSAGPPPGSGRPDTDSVSQLWPEILEAIKGERRVAWMLLSNASVHSVADGVLTVRFAREGDVKGFSSSGCDRDLGRVLADRFGLKLQVRAVFAAQLSGTAAGPTAAGATAADLAPNHPASSAAAPPQPGHTQPGHVPSAYAQSGPPRSEPVQPAPAQPDRAPPGSADPGSVRSEPARSEPAQSGSAQAGRARPGSMGPDSAPADRAAAASAQSGREDLTGMDLIKRELGGRVIAEIDEA